MRVLAVETSGDWCGVAIGGRDAWHMLEERAAQAHSERVLTLVQAVLDASGWSLGNLDAIAYGAGPGSFTGVRLACAVAQGLAFGADLPALGVPTLAALAQSCWRDSGETRIVSCIDARVREVYVASYERREEGWREVAAPTVIAPALARAPEGSNWYGAGNGFAVDPDLASRLLLIGFDPAARATAQAVGELALPQVAAGMGVPAREARPLYVRHRVALTTAERDAGIRL